MLDFSNTMENFHLEAHKYIGVPFRHRGRTIRGIDCVGLLILAARDCGYDQYEEVAYGIQPRDAMLENILFRYLGSPVNDEPRTNDVVLMRLDNKSEPSHTGIITHHPYGLGIIHSYSEVQKVIYHRLAENVKHHIVGVYRWAH